MPGPRVLIVSGIWPPDVGGPASHGPEFGLHLYERGVPVRALVSASALLGGPATAAFPVCKIDRDSMLVVRLAVGTGALLAEVRKADVVYATGIYHRTALACRVAGVPLVVKLVNDPAYERARSRGWFAGTLEEFQENAGGPRIRALRAARNLAFRNATRIVTPSEYLARIARAWGDNRLPIDVVPNPASVIVPTGERDDLRAALGMDGPTAVFAGRFVEQKALPVLLAAMEHAGDMRLELVGDGPGRADLAEEIRRRGLEGRVRIHPVADRATVGRWMRAADVTVLPSRWENFPHAVVESLALGTPVVATTVGGVPEILADGSGGVLVPPEDPVALGSALAQLAGDDGALRRLRESAAREGQRYRPDELFSRIADVVLGAARR